MRDNDSLSFERLEPRLAMTGVLVNEFLAHNTNGVTDQDGDRPDWIELRNTGAAAVNLAGWHLTDDEDDLDKWELPAVQLEPGAFLTIFASGKDRAILGQELHTNFEINADGEYLALVAPDGTTVVHAYDPFPPQVANVSFGLGASAIVTETLIGELNSVRVHVPGGPTAIDSTWYTRDFDDFTWLDGAGGVGFDNNSDGVDLEPYAPVNIAAQMDLVNPTAYIRLPFQVADAASLLNLRLRIRYDDGFGVYLNGTPLPSASRAAPGGLAWNSGATSSRSPQSAATVPTEIDISAMTGLVGDGDNVLAIHGLNSAPTSRDFLIDAQLVADRATAATLGYMSTPTPGSVNAQGAAGLVADTTFSVDRGFFTSPFSVTIATATSDAEIRYTLDGSTPTATHGIVYNPASPPLITTTTTLRAAAFKAGFTPTNVDTQTYIFLDEVLQQDGVGLPPHVNWGYAGPDWAVDSAVVNHPTYASTIRNDLQAVPTVSLVMPWNDWFGGGGQGIYPTEAEIERAVSMEYFTADGSQGFQIDGGIEIQGGTSDDRWKMDKLSMRVKFRQPYGSEKLDANLFHGGARDQGAATSFNTLILDAHLGYTWAYGGGVNPVDQRSRAMFIQDGFVSDLQNLAGGAAPHGQWVHLYINGLYWGLYEMHERADEHFAQSYFGGNDEDYDVIKHNRTRVVSADPANPNSAIDNYDAMLALVRQDMIVPANYAAAAAKIDVDDLITYMIVNYYVGNDDWAHQNWYASYNRVDPGGKWRYHSWDAENVLKNVNRDSTTLNNFGGPTEVFNRLMANPEFRLKFADQVQKHFYNGGLMTPENAAAVYQARMQEIDRAIVGESARWGDNHTTALDPPGAGNPYLRTHWVARQNDLLTNYFPQRSSVVLNQFSSRGWTAAVAAPLFSRYGGQVIPDFNVSLSAPAGTIWYTRDGSDPRLPGGAVSPGAVQYTGWINIPHGLTIRARTLNGGQWSPEVEAVFTVAAPAGPSNLRISELHYNPASQPGVVDPQELEFIELFNPSGLAVSLNGVQITQFADTPYLFPNGITLGAGERIVVAKNRTLFESLYGGGINLAPTGFADASLSNGGERIALLGALGQTIQDFQFDDDPLSWPTAADANGASLEIVDPLGDPASGANWRASFYRGGSPGASGLPPSVAGDFDGDNDVDGADFLSWQRGLGTPPLTASAADGDADGDRQVDADDLGMWQGHFGQATSAVSVSALAAQPLSFAALLAADEWVTPDALPASQATSRPRSREWFIHETLRSERCPNAAAPPRPDYRPALEAKAIDEALTEDVELELGFAAFTDLEPMPPVE